MNNFMKENKNSDIEGIKVLMVTETWLKEEKETELIKKLGLNIFTCNRKDREGGGVLIGINKKVAIEKELKISDNATSMIAIYSPELNLNLITIYVPPDNFDYEFVMKGLDGISEFIKENDEEAKTLVYGDYNLNCLTFKADHCNKLEPINKGRLREDFDEDEGNMSKNAEKIAIASKLIAMADDYEWEQIVKDPTFTKPNGDKSHLDLIFTSLPVAKEVIHLKSPRTKHDVLQSVMEIPIHIVDEDDDKDEEQKLNTQNVQYDELAKDIINIDWETKVQELDPSDAIEMLTNSLKEALLKNGAKYRIKRKGTKKGDDPEISKEVRKAQRLSHKISKKERGDERGSMINELEQLLEKITEMKEQKIYEKEKKIFEDAPRNTKGVFDYIRGFKKNTAEIGAIKDNNGKIIYKEHEKREGFADYFEGLQASPKAEHIVVDW